MTWLEYGKQFCSGLTADKVDKLLWSETSFPFGSVRQITKQLRSAIRAMANQVDRCPMCGAKQPFHDHWCAEMSSENRGKDD